MSQRLGNREYYDAFSRTYEHGRDRGYHALVDALEIEVARRYARGAEVLEAGCGTGIILSALAKEARRAVGVDLSPGMLEHAARRGLEVHEASVTRLPFPDASFDLVCSFKVLAHVEDIDGALAELARVTRPGGHLVLDFYNPFSLRGLVKRWKPPTRIADATHDEHVYTRFDTLADIERRLPRGVTVQAVRGVRVFTPTARLFDVPVVASVLERLERLAADAPVLSRLGGFLVVTARKST